MLGLMEDKAISRGLDGNILGRSPIRRFFYYGETLPVEQNLPDSNVSAPYYFVGD